MNEDEDNLFLDADDGVSNDGDGNHVVRDSTDQGHVNQLSRGTTSWRTTWTPDLSLIDLNVDGLPKMYAYTDARCAQHRAAVLAVNRHLRKLKAHLGLTPAVDPRANYVPVAVLQPRTATELITIDDYRVTPKQIVNDHSRVNRRGAYVTTNVDAVRELIDEYNTLVGDFVEKRSALLARIFND